MLGDEGLCGAQQRHKHAIAVERSQREQVIDGSRLELGDVWLDGST